MNAQGYVRVNPYQAEDAVIWWYVREFNDGFVFARGGNVRTARQARRILRDGWAWADHEHRRWLNRPMAKLLADGRIEPIAYGPYEPAFPGPTP